MYKENKNREEGVVLPERFEESGWQILAGNAGCFKVDAEAPEMGQSSNEAKRMDKLRYQRPDAKIGGACFVGNVMKE